MKLTPLTKKLTMNVWFMNCRDGTLPWFPFQSFWHVHIYAWSIWNVKARLGNFGYRWYHPLLLYRKESCGKNSRTDRPQGQTAVPTRDWQVLFKEEQALEVSIKTMCVGTVDILDKIFSKIFMKEKKDRADNNNWKMFQLNVLDRFAYSSFY